MRRHKHRTVQFLALALAALSLLADLPAQAQKKGAPPEGRVPRSHLPCTKDHCNEAGTNCSRL